MHSNPGIRVHSKSGFRVYQFQDLVCIARLGVEGLQRATILSRPPPDSGCHLQDNLLYITIFISNIEVNM
jgi:hypothetical protein